MRSLRRRSAADCGARTRPPLIWCRARRHRRRRGVPTGQQQVTSAVQAVRRFGLPCRAGPGSSCSSCPGGASLPSAAAPGAAAPARGRRAPVPGFWASGFWVPRMSHRARTGDRRRRYRRRGPGHWRHVSCRWRASRRRLVLPQASSRAAPPRRPRVARSRRRHRSTLPRRRAPTAGSGVIALRRRSAGDHAVASGPAVAFLGFVGLPGAERRLWAALGSGLRLIPGGRRVRGGRPLRGARPIRAAPPGLVWQGPAGRQRT